MGAIRTAYREVSDAAMGIKSDTGTGAGKTGGTGPAYLTAQISNYRAARNRLTGGG
jgi:hypothetical protein